jgi:hypothetical protein
MRKRTDLSESAGQTATPPASVEIAGDPGPGLTDSELEAARIAEAAVAELEAAHNRTYMLMGVVYGLLMALYLVLLFSRREAS